MPRSPTQPKAKPMEFVVELELSGLAAYVVNALLDVGLRGNRRTFVVESMVNDWAGSRLEQLAALGITLTGAREKGYIPVLQEDRETVPIGEDTTQTNYRVEVQVYGVTAYVVDELQKRGLHGKTREEVVRQIVAICVSEQFGKLAHIGVSFEDAVRKGYLARER